MRPKLSYANVVSTLCLFLLLGGGAAYAARHLGKNSVGTMQLKKNAVTTAKIKKEAVTGSKIRKGTVNAGNVADGSLTGASIQDGSLTGVDINQISLNGVRAANVIGIAITKDANCSPALSPPPGFTSERLVPGVCRLTFPNSVAECTATASIHFRPTSNIEIIGLTDRTVEVYSVRAKPNVLIVETYEEHDAKDLGFDVTLIC